MEIKIVTSNFDDIFQQNKIKWKLFIRKRLISNLLFVIIGILFITTQFFSSNKADQSFWNFETSFGGSFLLLSIIYFYHIAKARYKFLQRAKKYVGDFKKIGKAIEIEIKDDYVTYVDYQSLVELRWTIFTSYTYCDNYLFLNTIDEYLGGIIINRNDISEEQFSELFNFVSKKLVEKR
jgi:hypothetical protein